MKHSKILMMMALGLLVSFLSAQIPDDVKIEEISDTLSVISGVGGNIAVLKGDGKLLLIDAGVADAAEYTHKIVNEKLKLPVELLINTHYHPDHTGGNKTLADGKTVLAHQNCLNSINAMAQEAAKTEEGKALLKEILIPNQAFETEKEIQFGDETLRLLYFGPGHTSGDTVVVFQKNRVIHTGDLFFHNIAPYIDVRDGSNTENWIKTIKQLAKDYPDYKVIPGHGDLTDMKAFLGFAGYLQYLRDMVTKGIEGKKTIEEITAATSFEAFPYVKTLNKFMTPQNNLTWVYQEMTRKTP